MSDLPSLLDFAAKTGVSGVVLAALWLIVRHLDRLLKAYFEGKNEASKIALEEKRLEIETDTVEGQAVALATKELITQLREHIGLSSEFYKRTLVDSDNLSRQVIERYAGEVVSLRDELKGVNGQLTECLRERARLGRLEDENATLVRDVAQLKVDNGNLTKGHTRMEEELTSARDRIGQLEQALSEGSL